MPFLLMLLLTLVCLPEQWPAPAAWVGAPPKILLLTWACMAILLGLAHVVVWQVRQAVLGQTHPLQTILRRYLQGRRYHLVTLFVLYGISLYLFGYGWAVQQVWVWQGESLPARELLILAPFCVTLLLSWACFYDAEYTLVGGLDYGPDGQPQPYWSRSAYVLYYVRQNLALVFLPVTLLLLEKELRRQFPALNEHWRLHTSLAGIGVALGVFLTMPWILRLLLGLRPLPEGALRDRLLANGRRLRFRCSNILLWNTRRGVANAMVVGIFPCLRYIILSDRLVEELPAEEVEAVFGHEVGHVKHHHMLFYLVFLLMSIAGVVQLLLPYGAQLEAWVPFQERADLAVLPAVALLGAYVFLVFGFLSRRCERQADIYGCRVVSCADPYCEDHATESTAHAAGKSLCPTGIRTFISALERVAQLNGMSRERPGYLQSWQHSTVARRVHFLQSLLTNPEIERRFQWRIFLMKTCLLVVLLLALVV